jgi:hypothetical protein
MAIYRTNRSYTQKALVLFQAWALSFLVLTLIGFFIPARVDILPCVDGTAICGRLQRSRGTALWAFI